MESLKKETPVITMEKMPFFIHVELKNNGVEKYSISPSNLSKWLINEGYCRYNDELIKIKGGIAIEATREDAFRTSLRYVQGYMNQMCDSIFLTQGNALITTKNSGVINGLPLAPAEPLRDTKTIAYKPFLNVIVKIEKGKGHKILNYDTLEKSFVWEKHIVQRVYNKLEDEEEAKESDFFKFLERTSNNDKQLKSNITALGYLLHKYKDPSNPRCIIIQDENLEDTGVPEGGTGKGLLLKSISQFLPVSYENGKNANFNSQFAFQKVKQTTAVICLDDAQRNFDLESLFSVITDDMDIERKHQQPLVIPYSDSPKFAITTNYTIRGTSSSYSRRRFDVYLNRHYGSHKRPIDDFGKEFFISWNEKDWNLFDNFMLYCIETFLNHGLVTYDSPEIRLKVLKYEVGHEFYEAMEEGEYGRLDKKHFKEQLKQAIVTRNTKHLNMTPHQLKKKLNTYAIHLGAKIEHGRSNSGSYYQLT